MIKYMDKILAVCLLLSAIAAIAWAVSGKLLYVG
jgi:hypothetical protein